MNVGLAGFLSALEHNLMPNRSNEDEPRSASPAETLNRKDTKLLWEQRTGQMTDSAQHDVNEWRSALRSAHGVSEWANATQWCSYIPWALWCETAKRGETMITFITFIRHFPLSFYLALSPSPFIRFCLPKSGPLKKQRWHLNSVWAAKTSQPIMPCRLNAYSGLKKSHLKYLNCIRQQNICNFFFLRKQKCQANWQKHVGFIEKGRHFVDVKCHWNKLKVNVVNYTSACSVVHTSTNGLIDNRLIEKH